MVLWNSIMVSQILLSTGQVRKNSHGNFINLEKKNNLTWSILNPSAYYREFLIFFPPSWIFPKRSLLSSVFSVFNFRSLPSQLVLKNFFFIFVLNFLRRTTPREENGSIRILLCQRHCLGYSRTIEVSSSCAVHWHRHSSWRWRGRGILYHWQSHDRQVELMWCDEICSVDVLYCCCCMMLYCVVWCRNYLYCDVWCFIVLWFRSLSWRAIECTS